MKHLLIVTALSMFTASAFAASAKGKLYVNSSNSEGQTIAISGKAAKLLYTDINASHESGTEQDYTVSVRQSNTIVCIKSHKTYKCTISIDPETGEVMQKPLHYGSDFN